MNKEKILLFGGTAESSEIARSIIEQGYTVTLSTVSNDQLLLHYPLQLTRITGQMDQQMITAYLTENNFQHVICAVHPYATTARSNIIYACTLTNTPLLIFMRQSSELATLGEGLNILYAENHHAAARLAREMPGNILLTTGSRNLKTYTDTIPDSILRVYARVLNCPESRTALQISHIPQAHAILARGPFSIEDNLSLIQNFNIKILITKDGGKRGGTPEKLAAARIASCTVIMLTRPPEAASSCSSITELLQKLKAENSALLS